jgi:hypothetical protein
MTTILYSGYKAASANSAVLQSATNSERGFIKETQRGEHKYDFIREPKLFSAFVATASRLRGPLARGGFVLEQYN